MIPAARARMRIVPTAMAAFGLGAFVESGYR